VYKLQSRDGQFVQGLVTYSPQHDDLRLLVIPTLCFQVTENNSNKKTFKDLFQVKFLFLVVVFIVANI
jgi:hypothetical protein